MKHKHDMKRKCEEYFPLPWYLGDCGSGTYVLHAASTANLAFSHRNLGRHKTRLTALQYLVKSANLMPEAVALLKAADEKLLDLCRTCDNAMSEAGYFVDCKNCNVESLDTSIRALLAKLEGDTGE